MGATAKQQADKDAKQRWRSVMAGDVTYVRLGKRGEFFGSVHLVGMVGDLHGTVCSCCPRRDTRSSQ